eukprot:m.19157 g.19157  ORF g.19157 m.19157 type:complete len:350 (+) comp6494_c0_seq1:234-1283(+)
MNTTVGILVVLCVASTIAQDHHDHHAEVQTGDHPPDAPQDPYAGTNEEDRKRAEIMKKQAEYRKKHAGHEKMHFEILMVLLATSIIGQVILVFWKKHYFDSYQRVTLVGMWLIPLYFSIELHFNRMLTLWSTFSVVTGYVTYKATRKPLDQYTPRRVYTYFTVMYKLTIFVTYFGYAICLLDFLGASALLHVVFHTSEHTLMGIGALFMFYGMYFGVLVRDFAEISAGEMASVIGYYNQDGMPSKTLNEDVCAICGERLSAEDDEKTRKLACSHRFHEFCIRGWCIVGKKETCPYCNEKVQLKNLYQPWSLQRQDVLFSQLLDIIRYLVVWQPALIVIVKTINYTLGLE